MKFDLIYCDPAWSWKARSSKGEGRSAKNHYTVTELDDMKRLPVPSIAADRSVLCMWVIDSMIPEALELGEAWGFEYKTKVFNWVKTNKRTPILFDGNRLILPPLTFEKLRKALRKAVFFMGTGYSTRANPEDCFLFTRKKDREKGIVGGGIPRADKGVPRLIVSPVERHSQKPEEARIRLERLFGDVRRVELFARSRRPGWEAWGNEVEGSISLSEIE